MNSMNKNLLFCDKYNVIINSFIIEPTPDNIEKFGISVFIKDIDTNVERLLNFSIDTKENKINVNHTMHGAIQDIEQITVSNNAGIKDKISHKEATRRIEKLWKKMRVFENELNIKGFCYGDAILESNIRIVFCNIDYEVTIYVENEEDFEKQYIVDDRQMKG